MYYLNGKIVELLKEHKEGGEKFFNVLDYMLLSDCAILQIFTNFVLNDMRIRFVTRDFGIILSGKFGYTLYNNYKPLLDENFNDIIITNGGIRKGEKVFLGIDALQCKNYLFLDDSYYSGTTKSKIEEALKEINPKAKIDNTYVIYDGSKTHDKNVRSLFRYYEQACTMDDLD